MERDREEDVDAVEELFGLEFGGKKACEKPVDRRAVVVFGELYKPCVGAFLYVVEERGSACDRDAGSGEAFMNFAESVAVVKCARHIVEAVEAKQHFAVDESAAATFANGRENCVAERRYQIAKKADELHRSEALVGDAGFNGSDGDVAFVAAR